MEYACQREKRRNPLNPAADALKQAEIVIKDLPLPYISSVASPAHWMKKKVLSASGLYFRKVTKLVLMPQQHG